MGAIKNAYHDEICNRCPDCGAQLSDGDMTPCDSVCCPIPCDSGSDRNGEDTAGG